MLTTADEITDTAASMAPTTNNDATIPPTLRKPVADEANGDPGTMARLWNYMRKEGYAEQARLARDTLRAGIVSRAAAKFFNAPTKNQRAQETARKENSELKGKRKR